MSGVERKEGCGQENRCHTRLTCEAVMAKASEGLDRTRRLRSEGLCEPKQRKNVAMVIFDFGNSSIWR
jgi:hypothetical protein